MESDLPRLVLHHDAVQSNIAVMQSYCDERGVLLAPHAKTHLVRELCERQLAAGAWGLTAATTAQVRQLEAWGVPRIVHAKVLVDAPGIHWVATTFLGQGASAEYLCYVDSVAGALLLERELAVAGAERPLRVLLERGFEGGRTGVRSPVDALQIARHVAGSAWLSLAGVAGFEGLIGDRSGVDELLQSIHQTVVDCHAESLFDGVPVVTAGGSSFFDAVARQLGPSSFDFEVQTVLRSGCYVTHDHGLYARTSPLAGRLTPALEVHASVLSQPEPGVLIVGFGRRDVPTDAGLPVVLGFQSRTGDGDGASDGGGAGDGQSDGGGADDGESDGGGGGDGHGASDGGGAPGPADTTEWSVFAVNDHHAFLRVPVGVDVSPGTVLRFGISHPCGAFDRWRSISELDADGRIMGVVRPAL
ncbi:alanine racemase [Subtercola lobariae]|uniref:D-serine dehydratase-like domain-containing protein n=1 Tax=Subtercola lobariae TaxID=1588641 RepID=A0A917EY84_9MICO|nr:alanine racemase [Subtercola lobariae]GGF23692.1 hypothetical protein GCM10011399_16600 [Subtercola lobariae]